MGLFFHRAMDLLYHRNATANEKVLAISFKFMKKERIKKKKKNLKPQNRNVDSIL